MAQILKWMHVCVWEHLSGPPQYSNTEGEMLDHIIFHFQPEVCKLCDVVH